MEKSYLPQTYADYYYAYLIEEYGLLGGGMMIISVPLVVFVLSYFLLRRKNLHLFWWLLGGYLLFNGLYTAFKTFSVRMANISAIVVLIDVLAYWLILKIRTAKQNKSA